jgi:5-(carboxyamino)imidazole ribonucleotide synthase
LPRLLADHSHLAEGDIVKRIWPGETIGILGGGQLGRMLALEARRLGYRIAVLDPQEGAPAAQIADVRITASFDHAEAAQQLAQHSDVITLDTEHYPSAILKRLETAKPVRPSARILGIIQDRLEQRAFLESRSAPQVRHAPVSDAESLRAAADIIGFPAILKTRRSGYDGKGQARVANVDELAAAWKRLGEAPSILESFVHFKMEISVLLARGLDGEIRFHPIAENVHRNHILWTSRVPARIPSELRKQAEALAADIAAGLEHVGMMAVELFVTEEGGLLVNELAPRTHNSGHYSFGACATSQFEQHIRAICGLPLGDTCLLSPVVMLNLLGDLWRGGAPAWNKVLAHPEAHLHLYGKQEARPGRKMGHVLIFGQDAESAAVVAEMIARELEHSTPWNGGRET